METTAIEEVNRYSPQMGQSLSMAPGRHLCAVALDIGRQTLQFYPKLVGSICPGADSLCNDRSLCPNLHLSCRFRSPGNGRSSSCCYCPRACKCRNSSMLLRFGSFRNDLQPFGGFHMPCRACFGSSSCSDCGPQPHHGNVDKCTIADIDGTAPSHCACSVDSQVLALLQPSLPLRPQLVLENHSAGTWGQCHQAADCTDSPGLCLRQLRWAMMAESRRRWNVRRWA